MANNLGWTDAEFVPLVHSQGVVNALKAGTVDYGVMATLNHTAGVVRETADALKGVNYRIVALDCIPVHHDLFVKDSSVDKVKVIASHPQALQQCRTVLASDYPDAVLLDEEDTALAARNLAQGILPGTAGVLCRAEAGELYGLHRLRSNLEDDTSNGTEFELIKLSSRGEDKLIVVAGLGLIGGSMAKALKRYTDYKVYGWNRTRSVAEKALAQGVIDGIADDRTLAGCDLLIPVLYPDATIDFLARTIPKMKKGAQVVDLVGVKSRMTEELVPLALEYGIRYTGGHPMAGRPKAGYDRSFAELFKGASMILVPTAATAEGDLYHLEELFRQIGFGLVRVCDPETHDRMIAHTSQLAHVVSNCYVKSPVSSNYVGFAGGSYKDMTRVAGIDEGVWQELFIQNKDSLLAEIDLLVGSIMQVRDAVDAGDSERLTSLLREGREAKELIDSLNADQPSE